MINLIHSTSDQIGKKKLVSNSPWLQRLVYPAELRVVIRINTEVKPMARPMAATAQDRYTHGLSAQPLYCACSQDATGM